ncbi:hypothetical protein J4471_05415 [Candidatus Woesearchaeota archaeon]|nr:hypothetical protein [Candidatus Woesearchaeota archaeon]
MKIIFFALAFLSIVLVGSCAKSNFEREKPADLYSCKTVDDCAVNSRNTKTNQCCDSEAINKKYIEWYNEKAIDLVECKTTCPVSLQPELACENNLCKIVNEYK